MTGTHDVRWRIGDVVVDAVISGQPTWSVGDTVNMEVYVGESTLDGVPSGERHYEAAYGGVLGGTYGGAFPFRYGTDGYATLGGEWRDREDVFLTPEESPYGKLRDMAHYAGSATAELSVDGVPLIRENIPARASFDTYVRKVEPIGADTHWTRGAWVLVTGAEDTSIIPERDAWLAVELECYVLAPIGEYATRDELLDDLAPPVVP